MVVSNVKRVMQEVEALTPDERKELLAMLKLEQPTLNPRDAADLVNAALLKEGFLTRIPSPPTQEEIARFNSFVPARIEGRPVSEVLIEERR